jgi:hypothetical protein
MVPLAAETMAGEAARAAATAEKRIFGYGMLRVCDGIKRSYRIRGKLRCKVSSSDKDNYKERVYVQRQRMTVQRISTDVESWSEEGRRRR